VLLRQESIGTASSGGKYGLPDDFKCSFSAILFSKANPDLLLATKIAMKPGPGHCLAVFLLLTAAAAAQGLRDPPASPFGNASTPYQSITGRQRLSWAVKNTIGGESLSAGLFTAGFGTATDRPHEYGPHWEGFGKRYGMRFTGTATSNLMEASLGALWGEDPRYFPTAGQSVGSRIKNVVVMTFVARRARGSVAPAYARYIGTAGNNFLSNTWRADSESGVGDACLRTALGFASRMGGNAFAEFWPTLTRHVFHRKH